MMLRDSFHRSIARPFAPFILRRAGSIWGVSDAVSLGNLSSGGRQGQWPDDSESGTSSKHIKRVLIFPLYMDNN